MTTRESDGSVVPQRPDVQSGSEKPANTGVGKRARISRGVEGPPFAHSGEPRCSVFRPRNVLVVRATPFVGSRRSRVSLPSDLAESSGLSEPSLPQDASEVWEPDARKWHVRI